MSEEIELAIRWFKANGIPAHEDDGSVFIQVNSIDLKVFTDVQIHASEISHRADLQKGIEDEK